MLPTFRTTVTTAVALPALLVAAFAVTGAIFPAQRVGIDFDGRLDWNQFANPDNVRLFHLMTDRAPGEVADAPPVASAEAPPQGGPLIPVDPNLESVLRNAPSAAELALASAEIDALAEEALELYRVAYPVVDLQDFRPPSAAPAGEVLTPLVPDDGSETTAAIGTTAPQSEPVPLPLVRPAPVARPSSRAPTRNGRRARRPRAPPPSAPRASQLAPAIPAAAAAPPNLFSGRS